MFLEHLLAALLMPLAVEGAVRLWPRLYDCGDERLQRRRVRYAVILPCVALAALLVNPGLAAYLFVACLGIVAALDLAYHRISLPLQVLLVGSGWLLAGGASDHLLAGILLGISYLVLAVLLSFVLGPVKSPGLGDAAVLAAIGLAVGPNAALILLLSFGLIVGSQWAGFIQCRQIIPVGFYLSLALLIGLSTPYLSH